MQAPAPGIRVRGSAKGQEPEPLRAWKAEQRAASIEPRYSDLSRAAQQATKQRLFLEQTGQCVYCGRGIEFQDRDRHHVEHFRPRARYPDYELAYGNLFLSCGPLQRQGRAQPTCGNEKNAWFDEHCHVEPTPERACQRRFLFASDGRIRGDGSPEADQMIDVLNLNHRELIAERSALIEELEGELSGGVPLGELTASFSDVSPKGTRVSFANVAIHYLQTQRNFGKLG